MNNIRVWFYRVLVLVGIGAILYTWFEPWWQTFIVALDQVAVSIFPYGMEVNMGGYESWIAGAENIMPAWFTPFMFTYLGLCIIALISSLFINNEKKITINKLKLSLSQVLVSGVGLTYIVVVIAAAVVIAMNVPNFFDAPLQGQIMISMPEGASMVKTGFKLGYWLACAVGPLLVLLAAFQNKIIGKS